MKTTKKESFYDKYGREKSDIIRSIDLLLDADEQPDFITMTSVNGQNVAFLGNPNIIENERAYINKFIRIDQMIIPEFARMVNPDVLQQQITEKNNDDSIITATKGFFYEGQLDTNIALSVAGLVYEEDLPKKSIHACENYSHPDFIGFGICPLVPLTSYFDSGGNLQYKLMMLYLSKADIEASYLRDLKEIEMTGHINFSEIFPQSLKIKYFFEDPGWPIEAKNTLTIDWEEVDGIFLIPMRLADHRSFYYCILNKSKPSNEGRAVKEILDNILKNINRYNSDPGGNELVGMGNDLSYAYLDSWSIFIGKDITTEVHKKEDLYKPAILEEKIRVVK